MNALVTRDSARSLARCLQNAQSMSCGARSMRHTSTASYQPLEPSTAPHQEHGRQIWVFNHLQTNQVVYSLSKTMDNSAALNQLPFNGKKTVPRALRKDLWHPMATISFLPGAGAIGLSTFQKLREYRRLHELSWYESLAVDKDGKPVPKKKRGRLINDQKANSVADIAAVLGKVGTPEGEEIGLKGAVQGIEDASRVEVRWSNTLDAEFAETWSTNVIHDKLDWSQNNRDQDRGGLNSSMRAKMQERLIEKWEKLDAEEKRAALGIPTVTEEAKRAVQARKAKGLDGEGAIQQLTPEEEAEMAELKEAKRIEKEKLKEERRLAYEADQAARKAAWLATVTPDLKEEIQKTKEERAAARALEEDQRSDPNYIAQRQLAREQELERKREEKRTAKKAARAKEQEEKKKSTQPQMVAFTTVHDTKQGIPETGDQTESQVLIAERHSEFKELGPTPAELRARARDEEARLREEKFKRVEEEKAELLREKAQAIRSMKKVVARNSHMRPRSKTPTPALTPEQKAEAKQSAAEKAVVIEAKRITYEQDQVRRRAAWLAAGEVTEKKPEERPPTRTLLKGDAKQKTEEKERRRLAYEADQARRRAEWIAAGSPVRENNY